MSKAEELGAFFHNLFWGEKKKENTQQNTEKQQPAAPASRELDYDAELRQQENIQRMIFDKIADHRAQIEKNEAALKRAFAAYDQASPNLKSSYAVEIRALNDKQTSLRNELNIFSDQLKKTQLLIGKLRELIYNRVPYDPKLIRNLTQAIEKDVFKKEMENSQFEDLSNTQYSYFEEKNNDSINNSDNLDDINKIRSDNNIGGDPQVNDTLNDDIEKIRKQNLS